MLSFQCGFLKCQEVGLSMGQQAYSGGCSGIENVLEALSCWSIDACEQVSASPWPMEPALAEVITPHEAHTGIQHCSLTKNFPGRVALLGSTQLLPSHATAMTQPLGGWNAPERATSLPYILGYEDVKLYTKFYSLKEKKKKKSTLTQQIYLGLRSTEVLAKVWLSQLQSPMLAHLIQNSALGLCPSGSCH